MQRLLESSVRKSAALCAAESQLAGALSSKEAAAVDAVVLRTLREELERSVKEIDAEREARAEAEERVAAVGREAAKAKEMEEAARKAESVARAASDEAEAAIRRERERADNFEAELKRVGELLRCKQAALAIAQKSEAVAMKEERAAKAALEEAGRAAQAAAEEAGAAIRRAEERATRLEAELKQLQGSSGRKSSGLHVVSRFCSCLPCFKC